MQSPQVRLSAAGASPWIPLNKAQSTFQVGFAVMLSQGATLTYSVQHTFDPVGQDYRIVPSVSATRSGTTVTVTESGHTLRVGDNIIVVDSDSPIFQGNFELTAVGASTYQYTVANSGATVSGQNFKLKSFRVFNHSAVVAATADADGNYDFPVSAMRLIVTAYTSGSATLIVNQGAGRM